MRRSRFLTVVLATVAFGGLAVGCGDNGSDSAAGNPNQEKIAVLLPGSLTDAGYGLAAAAGIETIEQQFDAEVAVSEMVDPAEFVDTMRDYANRDYGLVMATGIQFQDAAQQVGAEFPETSFVVIDGNESSPPNVAVVDYQYEQAGFLGGLAAGVVTQTGHVAAVGGDEIPPIQRLAYGFEQGVKAVDANIQVSTSFVGDVNDPVRNKQVADALASDGADVIYAVTVGGTPGVFQAAEEHDILAIGYGADSYDLAPSVVLTTTVVDTEKTIVDMTTRYLDDSLEGRTYESGFQDDVFSLADFRDLATPEQAERIRQLEEEAKSGEFTIEPLTSF